jgi:hypothetical protein
MPRTPVTAFGFYEILAAIRADYSWTGEAYLAINASSLELPVSLPSFAKAAARLAGVPPERRRLERGDWVRGES